MDQKTVLYPIMFLCYSFTDRKFVERFARDLSRSGVTIWYDQWMMRPGDKLRDKINRGIQNCKFFGVIISDTSLKSRWVQNELDSAMIRFIEDNDIQIIPILIQNTTAKLLPADLRGFVYADFRNLNKENYFNELGKLIDKLTSYAVVEEPTPLSENVLGPKGTPLANEFFSFATLDEAHSYTEEIIVQAWPEEFCRTYRTSIVDAVNQLLFERYNTPDSEDILGLFFALFQIHELRLRQLPSQMLRLIDDEQYIEHIRAQAVHYAGQLDYPLGDYRITRLLSGHKNMLIYSVCEYLEYCVGLVDSEDAATKLLAIVNRPDSISYFLATNRKSGKEVEEDIRYYAARCLIFVELPPSVEELIVAVLRKKFPEIEDESFQAELDTFLRGSVFNEKSRLYKKHSMGENTNIFKRHPLKNPEKTET